MHQESPVAKPKLSRPVIYGLVAAAGIAGFVLTQPEEVRRKGAPRRGRAQAEAPLAAGFTEQDRTAKFPRVQGKVRNVFAPLVAKTSGEDPSLRPPNQFPLAMTGGKSPWVFTGTVVIDQAPRALVENPATGESLFVRPGDSVGLAKVVQVGPSFLVVAGATGDPVRLELLRDLELPDEPPPGMQAGSFAPVTPTLRGPIVGAREPAPGNQNAPAARTSNQEPSNDASASE